eukprot:7237602-Pyramimonas_sp.AAC.1
MPGDCGEKPRDAHATTTAPRPRTAPEAHNTGPRSEAAPWRAFRLAHSRAAPPGGSGQLHTLARSASEGR